MGSEENERLRRALVTGLFMMLLGVALLGILIAFLALRRDDSTGLVALLVVALAGFVVGFAWDWRRADPSAAHDADGAS